MSTVPISTNRGACESRCPRRHQLLLDGVRLHALVLGDLVKVLVPVRKRELRAVSEKEEGRCISVAGFMAPRSYRSAVAFTLIVIQNTVQTS